MTETFVTLGLGKTLQRRILTAYCILKKLGLEQRLSLIPLLEKAGFLHSLEWHGIHFQCFPGLVKYEKKKNMSKFTLQDFCPYPIL